MKKEIFEKNLAEISDELYFTKIKSDSKKTWSSPYTKDYHKAEEEQEYQEYHDMIELKEPESEVFIKMKIK